jgi:hypothetical protein
MLVHRGVLLFSLRGVTRICAGLVVACGAYSGSAEGMSDRTPQQPVLTKVMAASSTHASSVAAPPCRQAGPEALAKAVGLVGMRIYTREVTGPGVHADQSQVEHNIPLLIALMRRNRAAVKKAVTSLVFSHTHVVRLRVTQHNVVLADVGGRHILAPVGGTLFVHGRAVGHYLLSVQDDLGYVKLETRFIGVPLVLLEGSRRISLKGTLAPGPATVPEHGPVSYRGTRYESFSFRAEAFPRGALRISLLVPVSRSLSANTCAEIRMSELVRIAQRIWHRYALLSAPPAAYINAIQSLTGGLSYIRSGAQQIAGSTQPGPPELPDQGTVEYGGVTYAVSSFLANTTVGQVRVYQLVVL